MGKIFDAIDKQIIKPRDDASEQEGFQMTKEDIQSLRLEIIRHDKEQEVAQVARFDKFKVVITTIVAVIAALSTLSLWLEPPIRTLIHIFF